MDSIKKLIISGEKGPDERIKLMNGVMVALYRVDDKKERQEITQIFNNNDLILNFIKTYLKFVIQNKLKSKVQLLKHLTDYNMDVDILSDLCNGFENHVNTDFLELSKYGEGSSPSLSQIFSVLYGTPEDGFTKEESKNLMNCFDLLTNLVQNNPEGTQEFIINDVGDSKSLSVLHSVAF